MAGGGSSKGCSPLCGLVGRYLRQHAVALFSRARSDEPSLSSSTDGAAGAPPTLPKETEKDILISLTLVCREIKSAAEDNRDYKQGSVADSIFHSDCSWHVEPPFECHSCSAYIVSLLVSFLASNSQYVRHMAGKVLVAISDFLTQYVSKWEEFICLLWLSLQVAVNSRASWSTSAESVILSVLHCHHNKDEAPVSTEVYDIDAHFVALLLPQLKNSNWLMPAALIQVLHIIQKSLKIEDGDLAQSFLRSAVFSLLKVPWDLLSKLCAAQIGGLCITSGVVGGNFGPGESNGVFLGAMIQLLSSLVEPNNLGVRKSPLDEIFVYSTFANLVSELLFCCFSNCHRYSLCMYQYLRHKALVLMVRLSFWSHWQCSTPVSWLELLQSYFKDLLHQPIPRCHQNRDVSVEGSPFQTSLTDRGKIKNTCTTHLQRQATFLFLKCCFALIRFGNHACHESKHGSVNSFTCKSQKCKESCCFNALSELSGWLQRHVSPENYSDDADYIYSCSRFSLSFLHLYLDEDDLLFEMLMELLDVTFATIKGQNDKYDNICEELGKDISIHISNIFNPIHLFHLFLSMVHYDHLVLLDYLISKDTGICFLTYLLRCLRLVCQCWSAFVKFSVCSNEVGQPHSKRRKICVNVKDSSEMPELASSSNDISVFRLLETGDNTLQKLDNERASSTRPKNTFQDAKVCLLSLKTSVEDLNKKNLFPYRPTALLRSFSRFQELCDGEDQQG